MGAHLEWPVAIHRFRVTDCPIVVGWLIRGFLRFLAVALVLSSVCVDGTVSGPQVVWGTAWWIVCVMSLSVLHSVISG